MNRQMRRRANRKLNLNTKDIDNLSEHFKRENEERERVIVYQFLSVTVEALRIEFGFGQKRIERYIEKVNSLLLDMDLGYINFMDLMSEIFIEPMKVLKLDEEAMKTIYTMDVVAINIEFLSDPNRERREDRWKREN